VFQELWDARMEQSKASAKLLKDREKQIVSDIEKLVELVVVASSPSAVRNYERRMVALEQEKLIIDDKVANMDITSGGLDQAFELTDELLSSPYKKWRFDDIQQRRSVLSLAFSEPVVCSKDVGFRTPKKSLPFKVRQDAHSKGALMAVVSDKFELVSTRARLLSLMLRRGGATRREQRYGFS
ncbi:hypothetical protein R3X27_17420, partial [Tropicimonas sp. TH_r6]|uniref:hypothetical protein n=1 Tax=Tropicimonas sp. TH_r6 TaxID=3082085 RepID=UPI0029544084